MMKRQILNKTDVVTVDLKGDLAGGWGLLAQIILPFLLMMRRKYSFAQFGSGECDVLRSCTWVRATPWT